MTNYPEHPGEHVRRRLPSWVRWDNLKFILAAVAIVAFVLVANGVLDAWAEDREGRKEDRAVAILYANQLKSAGITPAAPVPKADPGGIGPRGKTGEQGPPGPPGPPGPMGNKGDPGDQGPRGLQGLMGVRGAGGLPGAAGKDGVPGTPGRDGVDGTDGADGTDGEDGVDGQDGVTPPCMAEPAQCQGATGSAGKDGAKGDDGAPGPEPLSASFVDTDPELGVTCVYRTIYSDDKVIDAPAPESMCA